MRFQVSTIFALFSAPLFVASKEPFHGASYRVVSKALLELPSLVSIPSYEDSTLIETNDPDTMMQAWPLHRELQFTDACNASYAELWTDEALNQAYLAYDKAFNAVFEVDSC